MSEIARAHKIIKDQNLETILKRDNINDKAVAFVTREFKLREELCNKFIEDLDEDGKSGVLGTCFKSLRISADSLLPSMIHEGKINNRIDNLMKKLERKLEDICTKMTTIID